MKVYIFGLHGIVSTTAIAVGKHLEKNEGEKELELFRSYQNLAE